MRKFLGTVAFDGLVVIGEGEKDEAPMLFNGEHVGNGFGPACDIAVDPIDGTSLTAAGRMNALSVIAVSDRGSMFDPSAVFYMDKLVTGPEGRGVVDLDRPIGDNIRALADAKGLAVEDMQVAVLDRPRHADLIAQIRAAGASTRLLLDGDVAGGINAARPDSRIDMCVGIGGTPRASSRRARSRRSVACSSRASRPRTTPRGSGRSTRATTSTASSTRTTSSRATTPTSSRPASPTARSSPA